MQTAQYIMLPMLTQTKPGLTQRAQVAATRLGAATATAHKEVRVVADRQEVFGVVYEPWVLDTWGTYMTPDEIALMASRFDPKKAGTIDVNHDNNPVDSEVIASYLAKRGNEFGYPEGAWVLGVKIHDEITWSRVKDGELNGFSFECMTRRRAHVTELEYSPDVIGMTDETNGHSHLFVLLKDDTGVVVAGRTSFDDLHSHRIAAATHTERADGHSHRFTVIE